MVNPANATPITSTTLAHNSTAQFNNLSHLPYANPNAPKGGTLSLSAIGTFDSINKWIDVGTPVIGTDYLFESLMTSSLSEAFVQYPLLADKVTYDPADPSWVIYHINPHAKFWDGTPVTADDVKASMDAMLTKGLMSMRSYLGDVKETQVIDKQTVKFIFKSKDNQEIKLTVAQMPIWSKKTIDAYFDKVGLVPLMGSGAYKVGNIEAGRSITYVRDPNYWGAKPEAGVMVNVGRNNFDQIKYVYYQNPEVAFEGFKAGEYLFRAENKARTWVTGYNFPAMTANMVMKEKIANKNPVPMQAIVMNLRRPIFQDIRVRQALTLAYDFEWLNKTMFYGQYERLQSFFHGSELQATGTPSPAEMDILNPLLPSLEPIQRNAVVSNWQAPKSNGDGFNRDNLLKARELLLQAGFQYRNMKLYQPNGQPAKIEFLTADEKNARIILPYLRNLQRLGFDTSFRQADVPQYLERTRKYDYDMIIDMFMQSLSPGSEQAYMWGSQSADEAGNQNSAGIKNKAIDSVIDKLTKAKNREDIVLYTHVLDRLLRAGYYVVPTYGKTTDNVAYWRFYEHGQLPSNAIGIDYWWVNPQKYSEVMRYLGR
ncbi:MULTISPECIES: extracellular solute-binding protein [unclassified Moraxella]|uniref:extracellular solute-binding protein n=1 Tax=unclassified Moraxella TaxID=2685852 RepID=UPI003AF9CEB0